MAGYGYQRNYTRSRKRYGGGGSAYKRGIKDGKLHALLYANRGSDDNKALFGVDWKSSSAPQKRMRLLTRYRGQGGYFSDLARQGGEYLGKTLLDNSGVVGSTVRGGLNALGYHGMGMYTGHGAYKTNALIDGGGSDGALFGDSAGGVALSHREYITDIFGPPAGTAFNIQSYALNPGLGQSFPFLNQIACNYEEYQFTQMIYTYKSTTTDIGNSTTGQCGTVIMAVNYNAAAPTFTDKGAMMEYFGAVNVKVTEDSRCGVECDPNKNAGTAAMYVRNGPVSVNQDLKTYDKGTFQLALANSPAAYANLPVGELWVDYSVILRKPKLFAQRGLAIDSDVYYTSLAQNPTVDEDNWFGTDPNLLLRGQQNSIGCSIRNGFTVYTGGSTPIQFNQGAGTGTSIVFPAAVNGNYTITIAYTGTGISADPFIHFLGNVTPIWDLYAQDNTNNPWYKNTVISGAVEAVVTIHVFVRQATGLAYAANSIPPNGQPGYWGGDNIVSFDKDLVSSISKISMTISEYQPLGGQTGLVNSSDRVVFVNGLQQIVVPA